MAKKRFAVSVKVRSIGVYEVFAENREAALRMDPAKIRSSKSLQYREQVEVEEAMEITLPDQQTT